MKVAVSVGVGVKVLVLAVVGVGVKVGVWVASFGVRQVASALAIPVPGCPTR